MSCLDCFFQIFRKNKYQELHEMEDLEEIVIMKNDNTIETTNLQLPPPNISKPDIKPVKIKISISDESEEVIYEKKEEIYSFDEVSDSEILKGNQKLKKRKKKEVEYSSDDSWDNSLIL